VLLKRRASRAPRWRQSALADYRISGDPARAELEIETAERLAAKLHSHPRGVAVQSADSTRSIADLSHPWPDERHHAGAKIGALSRDRSTPVFTGHVECRALRLCMEIHQTTCSSVLDAPQSRAECALEVGARSSITDRLSRACGLDGGIVLRGHGLAWALLSPAGLRQFRMGCQCLGPAQRTHPCAASCYTT